MKGISSLENVELYLYTSLNKNFTSKLLKKLSIEQYFPENHRRYCEDSDIKLNYKKHPAWVDSFTKRVMIVTPNKNEFD